MNPSRLDDSSSGLQTIDRREQALLAPYAVFSRQSGGRKFDEPEHPYRGPYQRDRDRIIHSAALRRLSDKTQVFTGGGDYHRTRLTHTMEVASIARTLARALRLNEDLVEALALLHDLGHPPFGHAGEDVLAECLADEGGFSHNRFALTLVEELEVRHTPFPGLNLTRRVLDCQAARADKDASTRRPVLEAQVVDAADSVTYDAHDSDDAIKLGLVTLDEIQELEIFRQAAGRVRDRLGPCDDRRLRKALIHELIDWQVGRVLEASADRLQAAAFTSCDEPQQAPVTIAPPDEMAPLKSELESFLYDRVYRHPDLLAVRSRAQQQLRRMYQGYLDHPERLPEKFRHRTPLVGPKRSVADYLAGMTDQYCLEQYRRYYAE